jgi:ribosomal protein S2
MLKSKDKKEIIEAVNRLGEIKEEIKHLIVEAKHIIASVTDRDVRYERARSYWIAHIEGALDKDNEWLGGSMTNMQDTIDEIEEDTEIEEEEDAE